MLHVHGAYNYTVQILDAKTTTDLPNNPPPAGTTAVALLVRVEAEPRNRSIMAPTIELGINYPSLTTDLDKHPGTGLGTYLDDGTDYLTEDQLLSGGEGTEGVRPMTGALQANTVYYHWVWQLVSEKANLTDASLCETRSIGHNCIPIGAIKRKA
ncbi:hypothetical protein ABT072_44450 [Streptomyces sp. NPDC002589]|uniref:hypothetical protein n=1 Tax=Streptomyces sp. NPDC002589 TaxID=3154420 RepID=UPI00331E36E2